MTKTFASQAAPVALAALLTLGLLLATNALASHQYRVAAVAQERAQVVVMDEELVNIIGQRVARA